MIERTAGASGSAASHSCRSSDAGITHSETVETVVDGTTGALVADRSAEAFAAALSDVVHRVPDREAIRSNAERFSIEAFKSHFQHAVEDALRPAV